jgi:hypothetical protein
LLILTGLPDEPGKAPVVTTGLPGTLGERQVGVLVQCDIAL